MRSDGRRRGKRWRNRHKNQQKNAGNASTDKPSVDADIVSKTSGNGVSTGDGHSKQNSDKRRRTRRPNRSKQGDKRHARANVGHGSNGGVQPLDPANAPQPSVSQNAFVAPAIAHSKAPPAYAALDLGTNNCRLLVATPQQPGRFRVIDAFSRIVRLGEGLGATGRLSDAAMDRAVSALQACATKLKSRKMNGVRLIATEACRRATNGADFLDRVEREAGLKLEIVDRETEARLAVAGCASLVDREARGVVLFDIGGGSSELALLDLNKRKRHDLGPAMISWTSLPLGVVTLSEKHGGGRLVTQDVFDTMVDEVAQMIADYEGRDALATVFERGEVHLLGTSGTVTTLAGIHLNLPKYDRRKVDGVWMSSRQVTRMIDGLVAMGYEERVKNPCIGHDRADLVLAGCAILAAIQRTWPCQRLRVADRGLREGLLTEMMNRDNAWVRRSGGASGRPHSKLPHKKRGHGPQDRSQR
ncbi:MAG: Ppx/GppA phosphatase family protein [Pseudomonadota bacterium]